jgi:hypothetical protein
MSSGLTLRNKRFLEAFDLAATKTLSELGDSARSAILYHAGKIEGMNTSDLMKDPLKFADALEKIFSSGSTVLEDKILESMCSNLGIPPVNIGGSFDQKIATVYASAFAKKNGAGRWVETSDEAPHSINSLNYEMH